MPFASLNILPEHRARTRRGWLSLAALVLTLAAACWAVGAGSASARPCDPGSGSGSGSNQVNEARIHPVRIWKEGGGRVLHRRSTVNLKVSIKNSGNIPTGFFRVWLGKRRVNGYSRAKIDIKRQFPVRTILPGWTVTGTVTIRVGRRARGKVALNAQAWGVTGERVFHIRR